MSVKSCAGLFALILSLPLDLHAQFEMAEAPIVFDLPPMPPVPFGVTDFGQVSYLTNINVSPGLSVLTQQGESVSLNITGYNSNGDFLKLSADPTVILISTGDLTATNLHGSALTALHTGTTILQAKSSNYVGVESGDSTFLVDFSLALATISVQPAQLYFDALGQSSQLEVDGGFESNSTTVPVKGELTFNSSTHFSSANKSVASVSPSGMVTAVGNGQTAIQISNGNLSQQVTVAVALSASLQGLSIADVPAVIRSSAAVQLAIAGQLSNGTTADLTLSAAGTQYQIDFSSVATISADGSVYARGNGIANVIATNSGITATEAIHVSLSHLVGISVSPSVANLLLSNTMGAVSQQLSLAGFYSDSSTGDITNAPGTTFLSSNIGIAEVGSAGLVLFTQPGLTSITATNSGFSSQAQLTAAQFSPTMVGTLPGSFVGVAAQGNDAFLISQGGSAGLQVADLSAPPAPTIIGIASGSANGNMIDIKVQGARAYVAEVSDLAVFDISIASQPALLTMLPGSSIWDVAYDSGNVYYTDGSTLKVINATTLAPISQLTLPGGGQAISLSSGVAFVAMGASGLAVVDVSIASTPFLAKTITMPAPTNIANYVTSSGRIAYVNAVESNLTPTSQILSVDASVSTAASIIGGTNLRMISPAATVTGNLLFATDQFFTRSLGPVFNVSDPKNPVYLGFVSAPPLNSGAARVTTSGNLLLVVGGATGAGDQNIVPRPLKIGVIAPASGGVAPSVSLTTPTVGSPFIEGAIVPVAATATDNLGISKVTYFANGIAQSTSTVAPYYLATVQIPLGTAGTSVSVAAVAQAIDGRLSTVSSTTVNVVVDPLTAVQGRLTNIFGDPVANANVSLVDGLHTVSAADGSFLITHVPTVQNYETVSATGAFSGVPLYANLRQLPVRGGVTDFGNIVMQSTGTSIGGPVAGQLPPSYGPYFVTSDLIVPAGQTLSLVAGQTLQFNLGVNLKISGTLISSGTATAPVVMTSNLAPPGPGQWGNLIFSSASASCFLTNTSIINGSGVVLQGSSPQLYNVHIDSSFGPAVSMDLTSNPSGSGNEASNNLQDAAVVSGNLAGNEAWSLTGIPYLLDRQDLIVPEGVTLSVSSGVRVAFYGTMAVLGRLNVSGTTVAPAVFTYPTDGAFGAPALAGGGFGQWAGIDFASRASTSTISNLIVRYAGGGGNQYGLNGTISYSTGVASVHVVGVSPVWNGGEISWGGSDGIRLEPTANSLTLSNVYIASHAAVGLNASALPGGSLLTLQGDRFGNSGSEQIAINPNVFIVDKGGNVFEQGSRWNGQINGILVTGGVMLASGTWTNIAPYVINGDFLVGLGTTGVTWAIGPGTIIGVNPGSTISVLDRLQANGSVQAPIAFTSTYDQTFGPIPGFPRAPAPGQWTGIEFVSPVSTSAISNMTVRYAGGVGAHYSLGGAISTSTSTASVRVVGVSPAWNGGEISLGGSDGIRLEAGAGSLSITGVYVASHTAYGLNVQALPRGTLTLQGDRFGNEGIAPVRMSANDFVVDGGGNVFEQNNVQINGISVAGGTMLNSGTWTNIAPFVIDNDLVVGNGTSGVTWTLGAGAVVGMAPGHPIAVLDQMKVNGTAAAPVAFTSARDTTFGNMAPVYGVGAPAAGNWTGLELVGIATASVLNNAIVRYAGGVGAHYSLGGAISSSGSIASVDVGGVSPTWNGGEISLGGSDGIRLEPSAGVLSMTGVYVASHTAYGLNAQALPQGTLRLQGDRFGNEGIAPIRMNANDFVVDGGGNVFEQNNTQINGISVAGGTMLSSGTWTNIAPYLIDNDFLVGTGTTGITWTLGPGTVVGMTSGHSIVIFDRLQSNGVAGAPVALTSARDTAFGNIAPVYSSAPLAGDWAWLEVLNSAALHHTYVLYAGGPGNRYIFNGSHVYDGFALAAVGMEWGSDPIDHVQISSSSDIGLLVDGSSPTITASVFTNNLEGITFNSGAPTVSGSIISGNLVGFNNVSGITVNAQNNWWGKASGPSVVSNPGGTGDAVSANVAYTPFLTSPPVAGP